MKKKSFLFIALYLIISFSLTAQSNSQLISNVLGQDTNVSANFINNMITTGLSVTCDPWDDNKPCTDLCDPWNDKPCAGPGSGISKSTASPKEQEEIIKNTMKHFEQAIASGKGGKFLNNKMLLQAQKKHAGYKLKAIKSRFKMYIDFLKKI